MVSGANVPLGASNSTHPHVHARSCDLLRATALIAALCAPLVRTSPWFSTYTMRFATRHLPFSVLCRERCAAFPCRTCLLGYFRQLLPQTCNIPALQDAELDWPVAVAQRTAEYHTTVNTRTASLRHSQQSTVGHSARQRGNRLQPLPHCSDCSGLHAPTQCRLSNAVAYLRRTSGTHLEQSVLSNERSRAGELIHLFFLLFSSFFLFFFLLCFSFFLRDHWL